MQASPKIRIHSPRKFPRGLELISGLGPSLFEQNADKPKVKVYSCNFNLLITEENPEPWPQPARPQSITTAAGLPVICPKWEEWGCVHSSLWTGEVRWVSKFKYSTETWQTQGTTLDWISWLDFGQPSFNPDSLIHSSGMSLKLSMKTIYQFNNNP